MYKFLLYIVCLSTSLVSYGQPSPNYEIEVRADQRELSKQFFIYVTKTKENIFIKYKVRVDDNRAAYLKDSNIIQTKEYLSGLSEGIPFDTLERITTFLDSISQVYSSYKIDSLILNRKSSPEYEKIVDKVFNTPSDSSKEREKIYMGRFMTFKFNFKSNKTERLIYAPRITNNNFPQLFEFVSATMALYRKLKNNNFLDKESTYGY